MDLFLFGRRKVPVDIDSPEKIIQLGVILQCEPMIMIVLFEIERKDMTQNIQILKATLEINILTHFILKETYRQDARKNTHQLMITMSTPRIDTTIMIVDVEINWINHI
jgi:hypothetical protein